jgi:folate-binding protein YgfZ
VERLSVHHLGADGVLLVAGPGAAERVHAHLRKFTFAEDTGLTDVSAATFAFALLGPSWAQSAQAAGIPDLAPYGASPCAIAGASLHVVRTNGYDGDGALVIGAREHSDAVLATLVGAVEAAGGAFITAETLEAWRILQGLPAQGHELTEDHNPLEAGLKDAVSFSKGCYVGQEVVARLNTYGKVSRSLVRLLLPSGAPVPAVGASVLLGGAVVGTVTSAILPPGRSEPAALAYVKTREVEGTALPVEIDAAGGRQPAVIVRG